MTSVAIVYHSGFGHTKLQAEAVARGAGSVQGVEALLLTAQEAAADIDRLDGADAIIFGSPTYMGSMSAQTKKFLEAGAAKWFNQSWKDKVAGAFTNSSSFSGDKLNTLVGLMINAMQQGMIFVSLGMHPAADDPESMNRIEGPGPQALNRLGSYIGPMAASFQVNAGDAPAAGDLATAQAYGARVATITQQLVRGRAGG
jgi:NAD(P)H dehydrogenase (quinone)